MRERQYVVFTEATRYGFEGQVACIIPERQHCKHAYAFEPGHVLPKIDPDAIGDNTKRLVIFERLEQFNRSWKMLEPEFACPPEPNAAGRRFTDFPGNQDTAGGAGLLKPRSDVHNVTEQVARIVDDGANRNASSQPDMGLFASPLVTCKDSFLDREGAPNCCRGIGELQHEPVTCDSEDSTLVVPAFPFDHGAAIPKGCNCDHVVARHHATIANNIQAKDACGPTPEAG